MNAAEIIQAAIDKLAHQRSRSSDGAWHVDGLSRTNGTVALSNDVGRYVVHYAAEADADLITTLHRTIDAQLAILREHGKPAPGGSVDAAVLDLARAILGEDS